MGAKGGAVAHEQSIISAAAAAAYLPAATSRMSLPKAIDIAWRLLEKAGWKQ
jgi:hypothetical protein